MTNLTTSGNLLLRLFSYKILTMFSTAVQVYLFLQQAMIPTTLVLVTIRKYYIFVPLIKKYGM